MLLVHPLLKRSSQDHVLLWSVVPKDASMFEGSTKSYIKAGYGKFKFFKTSIFKEFEEESARSSLVQRRKCALCC